MPTPWVVQISGSAQDDLVAWLKQDHLGNNCYPLTCVSSADLIKGGDISPDELRWSWLSPSYVTNLERPILALSEIGIQARSHLPASSTAFIQSDFKIIPPQFPSIVPGGVISILGEGTSSNSEEEDKQWYLALLNDPHNCDLSKIPIHPPPVSIR